MPAPEAPPLEAPAPVWELLAARIVRHPDGRIEADDVRGTLDGRPFRARAARRDPDGTWTLRDVDVAPCTCDDGAPALLRVGAQALSLSTDAHTATLTDGWIVVGRHVRIVPLPRSLALGERWRPMAPTLAWEGGAWDGTLGGVAGPRVVLGARGPVRGGSAELGASLRATRGASVLARVALDATGTADTQVGWDVQRATPRASLRTDLRRATDANVRTALALDVASDPDVARDLGVGWTERARPWRESRALYAAPSMRLDGWLPDDASAGWLARARLRPATGDGPTRAKAWVDAGLWTPGAPDDGTVAPRASGLPTVLGVAPRALVGARGDVGGALGPVRLAATAVGEGGTAASADAAPARDAALMASLSFPAWSPLLGGVLRLSPGAEAAGALDDSPRVGPTLSAEWQGSRARVAGVARVPLGADTQPDPAVQVRVATQGERTFNLVARWDPVTQAVDAGWAGPALRAAVTAGRWRTLAPGRSDAWLATTAEWLPWWETGEVRTLGSVEVEASPGRARAGVRTVIDLEAPSRPAGVEAHLGYDDGCIRGGLRASGSPARTDTHGPAFDLALTLQVSPPVR